MYKIISKIRGYSERGAFKVSTRLLMVFLMTLGSYVATIPLEFPAMPAMNDKIIHVVVFFGFAMLMDLSTTRKLFWLWKGGPLIIYGIFIEVLQNMTEFRSFELADIFADMLGVLSYFVLKVLLKKLDGLVDKPS